jgi:TIR domain-containing protein
MQRGFISMTRDVFLCHTSEDKEKVVRPLQNAFSAVGISCWLDEAEIRWGDSVVDKINDGLRESRFVIVVLSMTFVNKPWPRRELASALSEESSSGVVRVLPLLVGEHMQRETILKNLPLLRDKLYLTWQGDPTPLVEAMQRRLKSSPPPADRHTQTPEIPNRGTTYCVRCGARTGSPTECLGGSTYHAFVAGTGTEYCVRCGARTGSPTQCSGGTTYHSFVAGTGTEYCVRCGARTGSPTECVGGSTYHAFVAGTGN